MLPDYLKCEPLAAVAKEQTVICGNIRFTVITSRLFRIEQDVFYDNASQAVLNRHFDKPEFNTFEKDGNLYIETDHLLLSYKIGEPLSSDSLQITLLTKPYTRWNYGDIAVHNLGGTVSTLDRVSGSCKLNDGVCSIEGYSVIDDSETALFNEEGWFKKRKGNGTDLYFFGYGHDYINCVGDYCRLTGEVKMLPSYALRNWWSRYHRYSEESYLELMDKFKEKDIPFSVAVIDMDWHIVHGINDEYWNSLNDKDKLSIGYGVGWTGYTWNKSLFPDRKRFLSELHKRGLIFSRFSGHGSQRFPIGFSGDTYTSWESLEFQPYFTATASNIGYGWWSHDIGGHCGGDRDDELNTRWVQFGVFSPIFRFHSSSDRFLGREPWNYNSLSESVISDFMRLRHKLFPYLYTMNYRNFKEQIPLILPMYYTNPEEREAYSVKNQYWFGSELIASPITKKSR